MKHLAAPVLLLPALVLLVVPALSLYEHRPPPAHTGGFDEPSCASCHFDNPVNAPGGNVEIEGLPESYSPGQRYLLSITLQRPELRRAGFQMSARFSGDSEVPEQAGSFSTLDESVEVVTAGGIEYVQHTRAGTAFVEQGSARWSVEWQAPTSPGEVSLHVAANAANGDASEFGDFIQLMERRIAGGN